MIAPDLRMIPIVFGSDELHINEEAGLKVKIIKLPYFDNPVSICFYTLSGNVASLSLQFHDIKIVQLFNMQGGRDQM